ncbi:MAG TPA: hypothetical protein ENN61_03305, partial [Bacteroidaceae bacterium]|nr:hypothetical protein [Bacteroidaceae bacterium]
SYTGMFSQFVNIDEGILSKRSGVSREGIYIFLKNLARMQVITYVPKRRNPVVTYLEERLDERTLHISPERYNFRKDRFVQRIEAMLRYAQSGTICRSQFLLSYFGELHAPRCGHCDVCEGQNELRPGSNEFNLILEKTEALLASEPLTVSELIARSGFRPEEILKVVDWLIDHHKITRDGKMKLCWRRKD